MKISIIGAGNVGALCAMHLLRENIGDVVLVDVAPGIAAGKGLDLEDANIIHKTDCQIKGSEDIQEIKDSDVVVITAGLARKPGMLREELLKKNAQILQGIALNIKKLASRSIVIVVTNPLDAMTYLVLKTTGFNPRKVFGMGVSLDAARFANQIRNELKSCASDIEACVIGSHGETMLPLPRFSFVKGIKLDELIEDKKIDTIIKKTKERGKEIVERLGSGSAYFAPSLATAEIVRIIAKDQKRILGVCAYLNGEYGIRDVCLGIPCLLGKNGIEKIIELDLNPAEKKALLDSADSLRSLYSQLNP